MDLKAAFFEAGKRRFATVNVPTIGPVRLRSLTAREVSEWRASLVTAGELNERGQRADQLLVALCVVDEAGLRVFTDADAMSDLFDAMDSAAFGVLESACRQHTNVNRLADWKPIEDAAKNSAGTA